ncbi:MAG: hypothetical protein LBR73_03640 [Oscillospiraceae bacterium]|jgi:hypothetical protein|nr:hypothetical protein [Oscillospiraceae bacterium]
MAEQDCYACGKAPLTKNEVGLCKKLLGRQCKFLFCLDCLAEQLDVTVEYLEEKVEEFKDQGCALF